MRRTVLAVLALLVGLGVLGVLGVLALCVGTPRLTPAALPEVWARAADDPVRLAVVELSAPRYLLGVLAGLALGLAGALLQDALRNPLAAPELVGVSGGCALVVALVAVLGLPVPRSGVPLLALGGGLAVGALVVAVGRALQSSAAMLLAGLACSSFLSGAVVAVLTLGEPADANLLYSYLLGSLANRGWDDVRVVAPWVLAVGPLAWLVAPSLNVLRLGEVTAAGLGVDTVRLRRRALALAALLTAAVVATVGPVGFVALLAPHLARTLWRTVDARRVLPLAGLVGAVLVVLADQVTRALAEPREIAAGVVTVLVGAPVLLTMLRHGTLR